MFELSFGRFVSGALWGVGAGIVLAVLGNGGEGLRPITKSAVKAYLDVADRVNEMTAEARESIEDLYAEARAEQGSDVGEPVGEA